MQAYKTRLVIQDPQNVTLSNLPFRPGQHVEIVILAQEDERAILANQVEALLKETQALPQIQILSEEEITAEVAAYRGGQ